MPSLRERLQQLFVLDDAALATLAEVDAILAAAEAWAQAKHIEYQRDGHGYREPKEIALLALFSPPDAKETV